MDIYKKDFCGKVITAACCLHNICITNNDDIEVANSFQPDIIQEMRDEETRAGSTKRNFICDSLPIC